MIGFDWLGMGGTLLSLWLLGNQDRRAFFVSIGANLCWIAWTLTVAFSLPLLLLNIGITALNVRALIKWQHVYSDVVDAEDFAFECDLEDRLETLKRDNFPIPLPPL